MILSEFMKSVVYLIVAAVMFAATFGLIWDSVANEAKWTLNNLTSKSLAHAINWLVAITLLGISADALLNGLSHLSIAFNK